MQHCKQSINFEGNPKLLNLGCGSRHHKSWTNVDFVSNDSSVKEFNLLNGIPFEDESFHCVYHSHLLEHFPKSEAKPFINECKRVLKKDGILRIVVPDLEQIVRHYLFNLEKAVEGDESAQDKYNWIILELFDQMVRNYNGGEMLKYWRSNPMPAEDFVIERLGSEVKNYLDVVRSQSGNNKFRDYSDLTAEEIGIFRLSGEIHQWMYDRFSLSQLLKLSGFTEIKTVKADESLIPQFNKYCLDIEDDGSVRKPDSLFMEAIK